MALSPWSVPTAVSSRDRGWPSMWHAQWWPAVPGGCFAVWPGLAETITKNTVHRLQSVYVLRSLGMRRQVDCSWRPVSVVDSAPGA